MHKEKNVFFDAIFKIWKVKKIYELQCMSIYARLYDISVLHQMFICCSFEKNIINHKIKYLQNSPNVDASHSSRQKTNQPCHTPTGNLIGVQENLD